MLKTYYYVIKSLSFFKTHTITFTSLYCYLMNNVLMNEIMHSTQYLFCHLFVNSKMHMISWVCIYVIHVIYACAYVHVYVYVRVGKYLHE